MLITDLPADQRPRERLQARGAQALTETELLAIILRTGIQGKNAIQLNEPIVRHKDRLSPKIGKELLSEVDPGATFYSYTEGPRPVNLEARDRDLLQHRDRILGAAGPKGWTEFLEAEIAKRKQQRASSTKEGGKP